MKILLIVSPYFNKSYNFFPLGISYIASALRKSGFDFEILDMNLEGMSVVQFERWFEIRSQRYEFICISSMINNFVKTRDIVSVIKKYTPLKKIIVGGKITTINKNILLNQIRADVFVVGDGEDTVVNVLKERCNPEALYNIPGLAFIDSSGVEVETGPSPPVSNLKDYRIPFDVFDIKRYVSRRSDVSHGFVSIQYVSSRGCPYQCSYCNNSKECQNRSVIFHDLESIESDIVFLKTYGLEHVFFVDDIFTINEKRMSELCCILKKHNIIYSISTRLDSLDEKKIKILEESGCHYMMIGVETASPKISKIMNKKLDLDKCKINIDYLRKTKIIISCNFITGYLNEDEKTLNETYEFVLNHKLIYNSYFATPYPGTVLYDQVRGMIDDEDKYLLRLFDLDMQTQYVLNISNIATSDIFKIRKNMIVGSVVNIFPDFMVLPKPLLKIIASLYWDIIHVNSSRNSYIKSLTDYINQAVIKPCLKRYQ